MFCMYSYVKAAVINILIFKYKLYSTCAAPNSRDTVGDLLGGVYIFILTLTLSQFLHIIVIRLSVIRDNRG